MPTCWQFPAVGHQLHLPLPENSPLLLQLLGFHLPCSPLSPSAVDCQALLCYLLPSLSLFFSDFHLPGSLTGCPPPPPGRSPTSLFFKTPVANWELLLLQTGSSCSCSGIEKTFFHFMSRIPNRPIRLCWSESIFCKLLCPLKAKGLHSKDNIQRTRLWKLYCLGIAGFGSWKQEGLLLQYYISHTSPLAL